MGLSATSVLGETMKCSDSALFDLNTVPGGATLQEQKNGQTFVNRLNAKHIGHRSMCFPIRGIVCALIQVSSERFAVKSFPEEFIHAHITTDFSKHFRNRV